MWDYLGEEAAPLMAAAARRYGRAVLTAGHTRTVRDDRESVGRRLLQLVFGSHGEQETPPLVADLIGDPDSQEALAEVTARADEVFHADPGTAAEAAGVIAGLYRAQAAAGQLQALVDVRDLLYWDDPQAARAAYQEAVDAGHLHALINLARLLRSVLGDDDAAVAAYQRAISSDDPDIAAKAMYELALRHVRCRDADAARALLRQVIADGHPEWAPAAMVDLADLQGDDPAAAQALYRKAIETGNHDWSGRQGLQGRGEAAVGQDGRVQAAGDLAEFVRHVVKPGGYAVQLGY